MNMNYLAAAAAAVAILGALLAMAWVPCRSRGSRSAAQ